MESKNGRSHSAGGTGWEKGCLLVGRTWGSGNLASNTETSSMRTLCLCLSSCFFFNFLILQMKGLKYMIPNSILSLKYTKHFWWLFLTNSSSFLSASLSSWTSFQHPQEVRSCRRWAPRVKEWGDFDEKHCVGGMTESHSEGLGICHSRCLCCPGSAGPCPCLATSRAAPGAKCIPVHCQPRPYSLLWPVECDECHTHANIFLWLVGFAPVFCLTGSCWGWRLLFQPSSVTGQTHGTGPQLEVQTQAACSPHVAEREKWRLLSAPLRDLAVVHYPLSCCYT